jgi:ATP-dependent RNA helicase DOB1
VETERDSIVVADETEVQEYYRLRQQLEKERRLFRAVITQPIHALQFLQPGRLVRVRQSPLCVGDSICCGAVLLCSVI